LIGQIVTSLNRKVPAQLHEEIDARKTGGPPASATVQRTARPRPLPASRESWKPSYHRPHPSLKTWWNRKKSSDRHAGLDPASI